MEKFKNKRFITKGIAENVNPLLQIFMWECIDGLKVPKDYLQVFELTVEEGKKKIKHIQEEPEYIREQKLTSGSVFVTRKGKPLDRFSIWKAMKSLCESAGVEKEKVFPHNLRHLFARTYYSLQKDIVRLADILGHSSINTTRIYTIEDGDIHRRQMQRLGLVRMQN